MSPDPTVTISCDYLVELSDDGEQPDQLEPEIITLPPAPHGAGPSPAPASLPE
jgi:hypothetical protein